MRTDDGGEEESFGGCEKEWDELRDINMTTAEALEWETKRA